MHDLSRFAAVGSTLGTVTVRPTSGHTLSTAPMCLLQAWIYQFSRAAARRAVQEDTCVACFALLSLSIQNSNSHPETNKLQGLEV